MIGLPDVKNGGTVVTPELGLHQAALLDVAPLCRLGVDKKPESAYRIECL